MHKTQLFPDSVLNQTADYLFFTFNRRTQLLYMVILLTIIAAIISLFFIKIDIGVGVNGMIKPKGERIIITSPNVGRISFIHLAENRKINKNDTLFVLISDNITSQKNALLERQKELTIMLKDLELLTINKNLGNLSLNSNLYIRSLLYYQSQLSELITKMNSIEQNYERDKLLVHSNVLSPYDFENIKAQYNSSKIAIEVFKDRQNAQWQNEKDNFEVELRDIETKLLQITIANNEMVVRSPVSGVIQTIMNINDGSYVHSGQQIVEISPEGELMVECYVPPKDIGLLKKGQKCRIQIDAFNYNDWGVLTGELTEIFNDIIISSDKNSYYYKVYCSLNSNELTLKNGYIGHIKKGMSARTRFVVIRRSCAQLLYDKVDNWLNPIIKTHEEKYTN